MKRIARMLAFAGVGLAAGVALGSGSAQAAPNTTPAGTQGTGAQTQAYWNDDVVGYFGSLRRCERVGRFGEWRGRWDDYDCRRVYWGPHRGDWRLEVDYDNGWDRGWSGHYFR